MKIRNLLVLKFIYGIVNKNIMSNIFTFSYSY